MTPNENPYRPTICGEDYRLADLPRDAECNVIWRGGSGDDYENYISWLADYLHPQGGRAGDDQDPGNWG